MGEALDQKPGKQAKSTLSLNRFWASKKPPGFAARRLCFAFTGHVELLAHFFRWVVSGQLDEEDNPLIANNVRRPQYQLFQGDG
ncbi:hypothetical protein B9Z31_10555 [Limnohabitans sp. G3-2]|nr:hypothetical protein B9Z31_10555 [Limnohabitans sp. G3-2]